MFILSFFLAVALAQTVDFTWIKGGADWTKKYPACAGLNQSPINLVSANFEPAYFKLEGINYLDQKTPASVKLGHGNL